MRHLRYPRATTRRIRSPSGTSRRRASTPPPPSPSAGYAAVSASLTAANVLQNNFDADAVSMLLKVKHEHPKLTTLCGFKGDETSIDFNSEGLGPADAMLIAPEISVMASLTACNLPEKQL